MNERLGIAGCGAIGSGLARVAAEHGDVVVWARSQESAERAAEKTGVRVVTDLEHLADCTLVVEAVTEDRMVKHATLSALDRVLHPTACRGPAPLRAVQNTLEPDSHARSLRTPVLFPPA